MAALKRRTNFLHKFCNINTRTQHILGMFQVLGAIAPKASYWIYTWKKIKHALLPGISQFHLLETKTEPLVPFIITLQKLIIEKSYF